MKKIYLIFIVIVVAISSCDDFLDESPMHKITLDKSVQNYSNAKSSLNGVYIAIKGYTMGGNNYVYLSAQGGFWKGFEGQYEMTYTQSSGGANDYAWKDLYVGVNNANAAIVGLSNLEESKYPSKEIKTQMIAEAKCLRAWYNTNLFLLFSRFFDEDDSVYGLLYRDQPADLNNLQLARLTVGESYTKIFEDLDFAIENMSDFKSSRYVSKQLAQAIKAKLLLYRGHEGDYEKSLELVQSVLNNSPANFRMEPDLAKMYEDSWDSQEVLWARYLEDDGRRANSEFSYSYSIIYTNEFREVPTTWLEESPRYNVVMSEVTAPGPRDNDKYLALSKLCRKGKHEGLNDKYATYYFRYAELYLMEAELRARINPSDIAAAIKPLNEMRASRTNPVLEPLSAESNEELMDLIFEEIWCELCLENGSEYYASLRFMKNGKPWIYTLKPDVNFSEDQYCWPIPDDEMMSNKLMIQNSNLK